MEFATALLQLRLEHTTGRAQHNWLSKNVTFHIKQSRREFHHRSYSSNYEDDESNDDRWTYTWLTQDVKYHYEMKYSHHSRHFWRNYCECYVWLEVGWQLDRNQAQSLRDRNGVGARQLSYCRPFYDEKYNKSWASWILLNLLTLSPHKTAAIWETQAS